ncbi:MAG: hypothetical protein AAF702_11885 [Chloroflexota bacterium]
MLLLLYNQRMFNQWAFFATHDGMHRIIGSPSPAGGRRVSPPFRIPLRSICAGRVIPLRCAQSFP